MRLHRGHSNFHGARAQQSRNSDPRGFQPGEKKSPHCRTHLEVLTSAAREPHKKSQLRSQGAFTYSTALLGMVGIFMKITYGLMRAFWPYLEIYTTTTSGIVSMGNFQVPNNWLRNQLLECILPGDTL